MINDMINEVDKQFKELVDQIEEYEKNIMSEDESGNESDGDENNNRCENCQSINTIFFDQISSCNTCKKCGSCQKKVIDMQPEWRYYKNDDGSTDPSRCGVAANTMFPETALSIFFSGKKYHKSTKYHNWTFNTIKHKERSLKDDINYIMNICQKNELPQIIIDIASYKYQKISQCKYKTGKNKDKPIIIRGPVRKGVMATCVYEACKERGITRSPKELAKFFGLKSKEFSNGVHKYKKLIGMDYIKIKENDVTSDFIERFCKNLGLVNFYIDIGKHIVKNAILLDILSENPRSIAAGCLLLMADFFKKLNITKKDISEKCGISDVTMQRTYKKISEYATLLIPTKEYLKELLTKTKSDHAFIIKPTEYSVSTTTDTTIVVKGGDEKIRFKIVSSFVKSNKSKKKREEERRKNIMTIILAS